MTLEFKLLGCPVRIINGAPNHVHCLFLLNPQKTIAEVVKHVKGATAHFINHQNLILDKFSWQTGYAAYSVSESIVEKVFHYIKNPKQHHHVKTYEQEHNEFVRLYKAEKDNKQFGMEN